MSIPRKQVLPKHAFRLQKKDARQKKNFFQNFRSIKKVKAKSFFILFFGTNYIQFLIISHRTLQSFSLTMTVSTTLRKASTVNTAACTGVSVWNFQYFRLLQCSFRSRQLFRYTSAVFCTARSTPKQIQTEKTPPLVQLQRGYHGQNPSHCTNTILTATLHEVFLGI